MGALINLKLDLKKIPTSKVFKGAKGNYVNLTLSIDDEVKVFENGEYRDVQNVGAFISQSKDERENKVNRTYVGNGAVLYVGETGVKTANELDNGSSKTQAPKSKQVEEEIDLEDGVPF